MSARDQALAALREQIGHVYAPSRWITADQPTIDRFADTTQDDQFIHVDPTRAAQTPLGGTIAQGFLTLSLASRFSYDCLKELPGQHMGINYGLDRLRFLAPVPAGARVRGHFTLTDATARDDAAILRRVALRIEIAGGDTPALVADWLTLLLFDRP